MASHFSVTVWKQRLLPILGGIAVLALSLSAFGGTAWGKGSLRDLENLLAREEVGKVEGMRITAAYRSALRVGIEGKTLFSLVESSVKAEFEPVRIERILSLASQLQLSGLPLDDFVDKVREGVAKRADPEEVVRAAEHKALALKAAENLVRQIQLAGYEMRDSDKLLPAVAEALESGKKGSEIRRIIISGIKEGDSTSRIRRRLFR
jgi:hypothetical protein